MPLLMLLQIRHDGMTPWTYLLSWEQFVQFPIQVDFLFLFHVSLLRQWLACHTYLGLRRYSLCIYAFLLLRNLVGLLLGL